MRSRYRVVLDGPAMTEARKYYDLLGLSGVLALTRARVTRQPVLHCVRRSDCAHPLWLRIPSSDVPTYRHVFDKRVYEFGGRGRPDVIVDAGANIGLASVFFANRYPYARVLAIEPEASNFEVLLRNVAPYPQIVPIQAALWHRNEEVELVDPGGGKWAFRTTTPGTEAPSSRKARPRVRALTVDRLIQEHGIGRIGLLKVDIEGAEVEVFGDAGAWIDAVDAMVVEPHDRMRAGCRATILAATGAFDRQWQQGENVVLSRGKFLGAKKSLTG